MKTTLPLILFSLYASLVPAVAQNNALKYADLIDSARLYTYLSRLASDEFEGRATGTLGESVSAYYIAEKLWENGIPSAWDSTYFQTISMYRYHYMPKKFITKDEILTDDYSYYNEFGQPSLLKSNQIYFIGYGAVSETYDDLKPVGDIQGKIVMMFQGEPTDKYGISYTSGNKTTHYYWTDKVKEKKPQAILLIAYENSTYYNNYDSESKGSTEYIKESDNADVPVVNINEPLANKLLQPLNKTIKQIRCEIEKNGKPQSSVINQAIEINGEKRFDLAESKNVIGFIEGAGPLKDEYIVVSAHYDHEGKSYGNEVYNGADDNASGVSAVLEIARAFAAAKKAGVAPRRSIVFLFTTAEERGLYGSDYYIRFPIFPLDKTKGCLNLDMLGRISKDYEGKTDDYIYLVSDERMSGNLPELAKKANKDLNLVLDFSFISPEDRNNYFGRSDQYNFAKNNIPAIMLTSGEHDDYHKVTDDTERIDFNALQKRTKLAFLIAWEMANEEKQDQ